MVAESLNDRAKEYFEAALGITSTPPVSTTTAAAISSVDKLKTVTATASGDTAVWTPTAGTKFRLLRYRIELTAEASLAAAGALDVVLRDGATPIGVGASFFVPIISVTSTPGSIGGNWIELRNGYLSTTINNVLNVNLSAALTAGKIRVVALGIEE